MKLVYLFNDPVYSRLNKFTCKMAYYHVLYVRNVLRKNTMIINNAIL